MDPKKWELWRTPGGEFWALRLGTKGKVRFCAASAQERADKIDDWEREHPDET